MSKYSIDYGNYIRAHRQILGLSQEEVANKLGLSQQAYSRYERGKREPNFALIIRIAEVLEFDPGEFFDNYKG